jgi:hypothetical protein
MARAAAVRPGCRACRKPTPALDSDRALFAGTHDDTRVPFSVAPVQAATWDGAPAFAAPPPAELLKL